MFEAAAGVLDLAAKQIGINESPPNSNRTKFGEWFGWNGVAWCAIYVSWVFWHVGSPIPPLQTSKGCAYVPTFVTHAKTTGQWRPFGTYTPKPGDLIIFWFTNRPDHIAIVRAVLADGAILTIEGNTNAAGSREGGGVYQMTRRSKIHGFIDVQPKTDWFAVRRYIAGVVLGKLQESLALFRGVNAKSQVITLQQTINILYPNAKLRETGVYDNNLFMWVAHLQNQQRAFKLPNPDPVGYFGNYTKWWACEAMKNIRDGRA